MMADQTSIGWHCTEALFAAKQAAKLSKADVARIIDETIAKHKKKAPSTRRAPPEPDEIWIRTLQVNPAYTNLNVEHEFNKAKVWCLHHGAQLSRQRFINWLNKADQNIPLHSQPIRKQETNEPNGWREFITEHRPESVYAKGQERAGTPWSALDASAQRYIRDLMGSQG